MTLNFQIRAATVEDVPVLFALIQALAAYENLSHGVVGTVAQLQAHLFGDRPYAEALLAECHGEVIAYALFFTTYSTFLTRPGLYLEDLFVRPNYRRQGVGTALLRALATIARDRNYGRMEWSVLDWNQSAIAFYEGMGATVLPDWRICRLQGDALHQLAGMDDQPPRP
ncbi:GNAT family N-acetyltransferase [Thermosynechococcaceae cyanobacterium Okahandja]